MGKAAAGEQRSGEKRDKPRENLEKKPRRFRLPQPVEPSRGEELYSLKDGAPRQGRGGNEKGYTSSSRRVASDACRKGRTNSICRGKGDRISSEAGKGTHEGRGREKKIAAGRGQKEKGMRREGEAGDKILPQRSSVKRTRFGGNFSGDLREKPEQKQLSRKVLQTNSGGRAGGGRMSKFEFIIDDGNHLERAVGRLKLWAVLADRKTKQRL